MSKRSGVHFRIDQPLKDPDDGSTIRHTIKAAKVEKFKMKQTKLFKKKDIQDFMSGKPMKAPARPIRVEISFIIPADEMARQQAKYEKFVKSQEAR